MANLRSTLENAIRQLSDLWREMEVEGTEERVRLVKAIPLLRRLTSEDRERLVGIVVEAREQEVRTFAERLLEIEAFKQSVEARRQNSSRVDDDDLTSALISSIEELQTRWADSNLPPSQGPEDLIEDGSLLNALDAADRANLGEWMSARDLSVGSEAEAFLEDKEVAVRLMSWDVAMVKKKPEEQSLA